MPARAGRKKKTSGQDRTKTKSRKSSSTTTNEFNSGGTSGGFAVRSNAQLECWDETVQAERKKREKKTPIRKGRDPSNPRLKVPGWWGGPKKASIRTPRIQVRSPTNEVAEGTERNRKGAGRRAEERRQRGGISKSRPCGGRIKQKRVSSKPGGRKDNQTQDEQKNEEEVGGHRRVKASMPQRGKAIEDNGDCLPAGP